jgi:site-specific recombinase XerD
MLSQGVPLPVVSRVLGHASVAITAQVYAHMLGEDLESVAEKIDTFLAS